MNTHSTLTRLARGAITATALALLTAVTTAARPTPAVDEADSGRAAFINAASVPAAQLRTFDQPIPLAYYLRSHGSSSLARPMAGDPAPSDQDLRKQCASHAAQAKTATGWVKSRFESCQKRPYDLILRDTQGATTFGRLWFDQWILGFSYDGSRRVDYIASIENIRVQPIPTEDATQWRLGQHFRYTVNTSTSDPDPQAIEPQTKERDELLGEWNRTPQWTLTYTSPDKGPCSIKATCSA